MSVPKSSRAPDLFGKTAKDYRELERQEKYRTGSMKKRHLKMVSADERVAIAKQYLEEHKHMEDVAAEHHLSRQVVSKICSDYKTGGTGIDKRRKKQQKESKIVEAVTEEVSHMLEHSQPIWCSSIIQKKISTQDGLSVPKSKICWIMRKKLRLGYRKASPVPIQANSERCLVLRQQYALRMIKLLESGKRIINVDESWINTAQYNRRQWAPSAGKSSSVLKSINPRLSLIAALDTDGKVWFSLLHANTDSDVMMMYLNCLFRQLEAEIPDWKETSVLLLDNAKYHTSEECIKFLRMNGVSTIYSGPYSYSESECF